MGLGNPRLYMYVYEVATYFIKRKLRKSGMNMAFH